MMMDAGRFSIQFPREFDDAIWEPKGCYPLDITIGHHSLTVTFYDPARLAQEVSDSLQRDGFFFDEPYLVVIERVTRQNMVDALTAIMASPNPFELSGE